MKRQVSQGTARKRPWVSEKRHQDACRIFLWFALPTSGFSFEHVLIPKLPTAPFSSSKPNCEEPIVGIRPRIGRWFLQLQNAQQSSQGDQESCKASKRKAESQVVAELRATCTSHMWNMAISSNGIQGAQMELIMIQCFSKKKWHLDIKKLYPHICMYRCMRVCMCVFSRRTIHKHRQTQRNIGREKSNFL